MLKTAYLYSLKKVKKFFIFLKKGIDKNIYTCYNVTVVDNDNDYQFERKEVLQCINTASREI